MPTATLPSRLTPAEKAWDEGKHPRGDHGHFASVPNSTAKVSHLNAYTFQTISKQVFGKALSDQELANLSGLPDGETIVSAIGNYIDIKTKGKNYESHRILKSVKGQPVLIAVEFSVSKKMQGKGLGTEVFARMAHQAEALKVNHIETFAGKKGKKNGYYTWPRFGYDAPLTDQQQAFYSGQLKHSVANVSDLMESKEGRELWKEHGNEMGMKFDLSPTSKSRKVWEAYLKEKAVTTQTSPPKNSQPPIVPGARSQMNSNRLSPLDAVSCLPRKAIDCEFKSIDEATGTFEMYALVFGNVDRQFDLIEQGAVQNCDELVSEGWIALNHVQEDLPLATIDSAVQDGHGLKLTGQFHSTTAAQEARTIILERMARGKAVKTSIGYLVPQDGERYERINGQQVRIISKMSVYEASYVNLPANPEAEITAAKALQGTMQEMEASMALSTKGTYKVKGEDIEKLKAASDKCMTTAKALDVHHKAMKSAVDAHTESCGEMQKCMKSFTGGQQQAVDKENDGDEADKDDDEDEVQEGAESEDQPDKDDDEEEGKAIEFARKQILRSELQRLSGR